MRTNRFICRSPFLRQRPFECDPHVSVTGDTKHDTPVLIAWARAGRDADLFGIGWLNEDGDTGQVPGDGSGTGLTVVDRDEIGSLDRAFPDVLAEPRTCEIVWEGAI